MKTPVNYLFWHWLWSHCQCWHKLIWLLLFSLRINWEWKMLRLVWFSLLFVSVDCGNLGSFTFKKCVGCQDGYYTQHLVGKRGWTYLNLPADRLSSALFHGPSPLWCIASGNVWFEHRYVDEGRCYDRQVLKKLIDTMSENNIDYFDVSYYRDHPQCIRMRSSAFQRRRHNFVPI